MGSRTREEKRKDVGCYKAPREVQERAWNTLEDWVPSNKAMQGAVQEGGTDLCRCLN